MAERHITAVEVATHLGGAISPDDPHLPPVIAAVNAMVDDWHGEVWPPGCHHGAVMLAARLHRRRNSPAGVESFSEIGPAYVSRYDPDLDRLLRINGWTLPQVG